jgi:predicted RNase H-like HicB family nuclease
MELEVDFEQEVDGRWIAEIGCIPGVLAYGPSREEAQAKAEALAQEVIRDYSQN